MPVALMQVYSCVKKEVKYDTNIIRFVQCSGYSGVGDV